MSVATLLVNAATVAALAPCFWLVARLARRPPLTHLLAVLLLVKLFTPPLVDLELPVAGAPGEARAVEPSDGEALADAPRAGRPGPVLPADPPLDWQLLATRHSPPPSALSLAAWREAALAVWALVSAIILGLVVARLVRFEGLVRRAARAAEPGEQARAQRLGARLGLRTVPRLELVGQSVAPMLWAGFGPARVLLPKSHYATLAPAERDALVAHELAHYARRDHWVRWLELLAAVVFWWHPIVWLVRRALRRAEEECCDARVLEILPGQARAYAEALLGVIDLVSAEPDTLPVGASGMGEVGSLERRLTMIMQSTPRGRLSGWGKAGVAVLGALVLPLGAALAQEGSGNAPPADPVAQEKAAAERAAQKATEEARARDYAAQRGAAEDRFAGQRQEEARAELERLTATLRERFEALMQEGRYGEAKATARRLRVQLERGGPADTPHPSARQAALERAAEAARSDNPLLRILATREHEAATRAAEAHRAQLDVEARSQERRLEEYVLARRNQPGLPPGAPAEPAPAPWPAGHGDQPAREQIQALEKKVQDLSDMIEKLRQEMAAQRQARNEATRR